MHELVVYTDQLKARFSRNKTKLSVNQAFYVTNAEHCSFPKKYFASAFYKQAANACYYQTDQKYQRLDPLKVV